MSEDTPEKFVVEDVEPGKGVPVPICPHCDADPLPVMFRPLQLGPIKMVVAFCAKCRKPVPVHFLPVEKDSRIIH